MSAPLCVSRIWRSELVSSQPLRVFGAALSPDQLSELGPPSPRLRRAVFAIEVWPAGRSALARRLARMAVIETASPEWRSGAGPSSYTRVFEFGACHSWRPPSLFELRRAVFAREGWPASRSALARRLVGSGENRTSCRKGTAFTGRRRHQPSLLALPEVSVPSHIEDVRCARLRGACARYGGHPPRRRPARRSVSAGGWRRAEGSNLCPCGPLGFRDRLPATPAALSKGRSLGDRLATWRSVGKSNPSHRVDSAAASPEA